MIKQVYLAVFVTLTISSAWVIDGFRPAVAAEERRNIEVIQQIPGQDPASFQQDAETKDIIIDQKNDLSGIEPAEIQLPWQGGIALSFNQRIAAELGIPSNKLKDYRQVSEVVFSNNSMSGTSVTFSVVDAGGNVKNYSGLITWKWMTTAVEPGITNEPVETWRDVVDVFVWETDPAATITVEQSSEVVKDELETQAINALILDRQRKSATDDQEETGLPIKKKRTR